MDVPRSGCVLLQTISEKHGGRQIVLVEEDFEYKCMNLPGGHIKDNESISEGTSRELFEETRKTVYIHPEDILGLPYKDIDIRKRIIRIYLTRPMPINCNAYYVIDTQNLDSAYRETCGMIRFDLDSFKTTETVIMGKKIKYVCRDENGKKHIIADRVFLALQAHNLYELNIFDS